jgi:hypothetical protein
MAITGSKGYETGVTVMAAPVLSACCGFCGANPMLVISVDNNSSSR